MQLKCPSEPFLEKLNSGGRGHLFRTGEYSDRLQALNMPTLAYRHVREDTVNSLLSPPGGLIDFKHSRGVAYWRGGLIREGG